MSAPGRACPLSYRYRPDDIAERSADLSCTTLFVVGCLYGNTTALHAVLARAAEETSAAVAFNGDFHWLDTDPAEFSVIAEAVGGHWASLGNVEAELTSATDRYGCGCAYPDYFDDATVDLSNSIAATLRRTADRLPEQTARLAHLPRFLVADVAGHRIGVVHGDPESLAGWRLALEAMEPADHILRDRLGWRGTATTQADVADWFRRANVEVLASSHTGIPYAQDYELAEGRRLVINNGRTGMPNFAGTMHGVMTRISADPGPVPDSLYGTTVGDLRCDAVPVHFDANEWRRRFLAQWPAGSAAHRAYLDLLRTGGPVTVNQAARTTAR